MRIKALLLGILLLVGGVLLGFYGYCLDPAMFAYLVGQAGIGGLLSPLILIFLGVILTWYGFTADNSD